MKIGDLVKPINPEPPVRGFQTTLVEHDWRGVIVDWDGVDPVVYWSEKFPAEIEYKEQLEVINESR